MGLDDHVRGPQRAPLVIVHADFECPFCAVLESRLDGLALRCAFRHFPVASKHPRAWPAAQAAEAAGYQGAFWAMHDALFADPARLEDPHLWERAKRLGLDLARFDADRRSAPVRARVQADFDAAVRGGVVTTPTVAVEGVLYAGAPDAALMRRLTALVDQAG